tara:strand:+ start:1563 stop:1697 length:135 start_codon:yes stop_codon:yes gene_type:complete
MKKRKLNSANPKYKKEDKDKSQYKRVLMKETKMFKLYFLYETNE